jgi:hypothetical protein
MKYRNGETIIANIPQSLSVIALFTIDDVKEYSGLPRFNETKKQRLIVQFQGTSVQLSRRLEKDDKGDEASFRASRFGLSSYRNLLNDSVFLILPFTYHDSENRVAEVHTK